MPNGNHEITISRAPYRARLSVLDDGIEVRIFERVGGWSGSTRMPYRQITRDVLYVPFHYALDKIDAMLREAAR